MGKKIIIGIASAALLLVVVVIGGGYILLQSLDLNKVKTEIASVVKKGTGRDLSIGSLSIDVGLSPTIALRDTTLSNPAWAKNKNLLKIQEANVSFDILPLIHKELKVNEVNFAGVDAALEISKQGQKSWEMGTSTQEKEQAKQEASSKFGVDFDKISGKNVRVIFNDQTENKTETIVVSTLELTSDPNLIVTASVTRGDADYNVEAKGESLDAVMQGSPVTLAFKGTSTKSDAKINLDGTAKNVTADAAFIGSIAASANSLADFAAFTGSPLPASEPISLDSKLSATAKKVTLSSMNAAVSDKKGTGTITADLTKQKPFVSGNLVLPEIALASSGNAVPSEGSAKGTNNGKVIPNIDLPGDALNAADADLTITIDSLTLPDYKLANIKLPVKLQNTKLSIAPFSFSLGGSAITGNAGLSPSGASFAVSGNSVPLKALAKGPLNGGSATFNIKTSGQGKNLQSVMSTLTGNASFFLKDATYEPKNAKVGDLLNILNGGKGNSAVVLSCAASNFTISQGVANSTVLVADTSAARVDGTGSINLGQETMQLMLKPTPKAAGLNQLAVPIRVSGTFADPRVVPDPKGTALAAAQVGLGFSKNADLNALGSLLGQASPSADASVAQNSPCFSAPTQTDATSPQPSTLKDTIKQQENRVRDIRDNLKGLKNLF
ncbi:MAG: AsmA family protein [Rickettsiales bacterium]